MGNKEPPKRTWKEWYPILIKAKAVWEQRVNRRRLDDDRSDWEENQPDEWPDESEDEPQESDDC